MRLFLPTPYPDELLLSVLTRRANWLGTGWSEDLADTFGRYPVAVDMPGDLSKLFERAGTMFDPGRVLDEMTVLPFYGAFLPSARMKAVRHAIVTGGHPSGRVLLGLLGRGTRGFRPPAYARICLSCRESDIARFGETYWRRQHQIGGVLFCPQHGDALTDTSHPFLGRHGVRLPDLLEVPARRSTVVDGLSREEVDLARKVGRRCVDLLEGRQSTWDEASVASGRYKRQAIERGLGLNRSRVDGTALETAFVERFGETLLDLWQVHVPQGISGSWLRRAFRDEPGVLAPLEHALVQVFMEELPNVEAAVPSFGLGPWTCPNRFADHSRRIENVRVIGTRDRPIATATCTCGYRFTFEEVEGDGSTPKVLSHVRLPETFRNEVRRLVALGLHPDEVATRLGLPKRRIGLIMTGKRNAFEWEDTDMEQMRSRWLLLLADVPDRSRMEARRRDPSLFRALSKNDHAWMAAQDRERKGKPPRAFKDWARDDLSYAERVADAVSKLRQKTDGPRLTRSFIVQQAGLSDGLVRHEDMLPQTHQVLNASTETTENYYLRRARHAAAELEASGAGATVTKLRAAMSALSSQTRTALSDPVLARIVSEFDTG